MRVALRSHRGRYGVQQGCKSVEGGSTEVPDATYFDDFPHVDVEGMAVRSQVVMEEAMRTLGWGIAEEQTKRAPPAQSRSRGGDRSGKSE